MNLQLPIPGIETGPQYAVDNNNAFLLLDSHTHVAGQGQPIPTAALNINADLSFNSYNQTTIRSSRFNSQTSPLSLITDRNCIYVNNGNLYFNDFQGNQVQLTLDGAVDTSTSGNITGMGATTASVVYTNGNKTFSFYSNLNTPALISIGPLSIGTNSVSPNQVTLTTSGTIPAPYQLTFADALPTSQSFVSVSNTGILSNIAPDDTTTSIVGGLLKANLPPGMLMTFAGSGGLAGWVLCDGATLSRTTYADLFTAIGTAWGTGDGSTTFNIPDLRGMFLRGVSGGSGNDPDASSRTASGPGGNTGNNVGSYEGDTFRSHQHNITDPGHTHTATWSSSPAGSSRGFVTNANAGTGNISTNTTGITINNTGGNETRPINIYVNYYIKI